jgi:dihydropteroate synthase type 2
VLQGLAQNPSTRIPISIDATEPDVLRFAMKQRVSFLNDVRGFPDPALHEELSHGEAALIVMHSLVERDRATRDHVTPQEALDSIERFFEKRLTELVAAGIAERRLIVDPGMGFFLGRDPNASLEVLRRIPELRKRFGLPVLISVSRKSFLRRITGRETADIGPATLAAELYAANQGADYLRTHDAAALNDALTVNEALAGSPSDT